MKKKEHKVKAFLLMSCMIVKILLNAFSIWAIEAEASGARYYGVVIAYKGDGDWNVARKACVKGGQLRVYDGYINETSRFWGSVIARERCASDEYWYWKLASGCKIWDISDGREELSRKNFNRVFKNREMGYHFAFKVNSAGKVCEIQAGS